MIGTLGDPLTALRHFEAALELVPDYGDARLNAKRAQEQIKEM